jgi:selenocysteine lyase/cysteine desulfurase
MEEVFYERRAALPNQGQAFQEFLRMYPLYLDTLAVDHIREDEYPHLNERSQVCLDYMGVGLFSHAQQAEANSQSAALGLAYVSANLVTHALYTAEETEVMVRRRVLRYMNIDENEYAIVFTANKLSAFKLLGESYPFHISSKLLLGYDHRCESQDALAECARSKGATVLSANLAWPSLKLDKADVRKKLVLKRKAGRSKGWGFHSAHGAANAGDYSPNQQQMPMGAQGIMAYPVMSCGSGAKNSLQWIREAGQNGWHVLLDVSGLGAKAMDTLGLNLFHPDFIVGSFYKVFGSDPTGFGCLVIKKSVIQSLGDSSRARAIGMVKIVSTAATSSTSTSGSWDSFRSSSPMELHHRSTRSAPLNEALNAQFEERFSSSQIQSKAKAPRPRDDVEVLSEMEDVQRQEEAASWVRSQSSPSTTLGHRPRSASSGCGECGSGASLENEEGEIVVTLNPRAHRRHYSEAEGGQQDAAHGSRPLEMRAKEAMAGLRYLQIPKQGWDQKTSGDDESFLSRDFGKKSPLMLTLPKGFDSSGDRTPPLSMHEVRQEVLVGSLPDTPSSVSAPCSPRCPCPRQRSGHLEAPGKIVCRGLDLADKIGLSRINFRLRALINWLISSLRKLRHSTAGHPHVVLIYGPLCQNDRSSTFSFNIAGSDGQLLDPVLVQRLADRSSISLGTSIIQGSFVLEVDEDEAPKASKRSSRTKKSGYKSASGVRSSSPPRGVNLARQMWSSADDPVQTGHFSVLCASLCFLSSFTDVHRVLEFVALFLDADFVTRELFHYRALNQQTILM